MVGGSGRLSGWKVRWIWGTAYGLDELKHEARAYGRVVSGAAEESRAST